MGRGAANQYTGPKDPEERFWYHVNKTDGCWEWTGYRDKVGYGRFKMGTKKVFMSHRAAYTLFKGPIPDGLLVCHRCDNPSCVNPDHLFLGTHLDNNLDCVNKDRKGKLSMEERKQIAKEPGKLNDVAQKYGLSFQYISALRKRYGE